MSVRDALNSALDEEMSADPKVFLMGEEVIQLPFLYYIYIIYWKMNYFWFLMLSLVVIECRLGNIRVHTRLVMCFHFQLLVAASRGFKNL